jgi:hypothetical protein
MGDYSPHVLELARAAVTDHTHHVAHSCSRAQQPMTALGFLRFKVFLVYISNVDNLPTDEIATIGQREHLVQTRLPQRGRRRSRRDGQGHTDAGRLIDNCCGSGRRCSRRRRPAHPDPIAGVAFCGRAGQPAAAGTLRPLRGLDTCDRPEDQRGDR